MTTGKFLLAALMASAAIATARAAEPVHVQLNSFSLRFQQVNTRIFGITYTHRVSSRGVNEDSNGEMRVSPPANPTVPEVPLTHKGVFFYYDGQFNETFPLPFTLDIPADDDNGNHIPDLYELNSTIYTRTTGLYVDPNDEIGTFTADWEKNTGSAFPICRIQYDIDEGTSLRFSHFFEIYQYSGQFTPGTPAADGTASAPITLTRDSDGPAESLSGTIHYKMEAGKLTILQATVLKDQANTPILLAADASSTFQDGKIYTLLDIVDGLPSLEPIFEDYKEWSLMLTDPNDTDHDGTPDLFEGPPAVAGRAPKLEIARTANGIRLTIHADVGVPYTLEDSAALPAAAWSHPATITLPTDPHMIDLPAPTTPTFWRMRLP